MSIYATGFELAVSVYVACSPEESELNAITPGGQTYPIKQRLVEVYFQHVPNHINEENGYTDDWLPPFKHRKGCVRRVETYTVKSGPYEGQERTYTDCDCGDRCVFVLDEDNDAKIGQRYTNPLLVLSGPEYRAAKFDALMGRIDEAITVRYSGPPVEGQGNG